MQLSRQQKAAFNAAAANRAHMARTGMTHGGHLLWRTMEVDTIRRLYPDYGALLRALPGRTRAAIAKMAWRIGVTRPLRVWRDAEFGLMKPLYLRGEPMAEIMERLPGKTARQIWSKAAHCRIRRPRRPPRATGLGPVDDIRRRAFDLNMSMTDLDMMAGGRCYFRRPRRTDWTAIQKVLPHLGGIAVVHWHEG